MGNRCIAIFIAKIEFQENAKNKIYERKNFLEIDTGKGCASIVYRLIMATIML